jgi:hypothetical protein
LPKKLSVFGADGPKKLVGFKDNSGEDRDNFKLVEHVGSVAIFRVHGVEDVKTNLFGVRPAVKVDVTIVGEDGEGETFKNVLIFNAVPVDQLRDYAGQTLVARVGTYDKKTGGQAPKLIEASAEEQELAEALAA